MRIEEYLAGITELYQGEIIGVVKNKQPMMLTLF